MGLDQIYRFEITNFQSVYLGAGEGNRTLVLSLEGFSSTIELHPHLATVISILINYLFIPSDKLLWPSGTCKSCQKISLQHVVVSPYTRY